MCCSNYRELTNKHEHLVLKKKATDATMVGRRRYFIRAHRHVVTARENFEVISTGCKFNLAAHGAE
jgi:hypothetical protein